MPQTPLIATLLLIISLTVHTVKSDSHVIVRPTDSDPSVCGDHTDATVVCYTLSNLISNNQLIFSDSEYSTFEFRIGRHEVSVKGTTHLLVSITGALTWQGSELGDTTINCKRPLVFVFLNITLLTLRNLNFLECGHSLPNLHFISQYESQITRASAAVALLNLTSFHMQSVTISQSRGYGLLGLNLRGENSISSSHFLRNNAKTECSANECVRGNAAFYFYRREVMKNKNLGEEVALLITHSIFQNGADLSNESTAFKCSELHNNLTLHPIFRTNGLAIIAGQRKYRVEIQVTDTNFSRNTGNGLHPAVWVHDYGGVADNRFEFINCSFEREGTLRISSLENKHCAKNVKNKVCYVKNYQKNPRNHSISHVQVVDGHFTSGSHSALEICTNPTYVRFNKFQLISIIGCIFQNYKPTTVKQNISLVNINYITKYVQDKYPSIAIIVAKSQFVSNKIPLLVCQLGRDTYAETFDRNSYSYQKIVNLEDNVFRDNFHVNRSFVLFRAPNNGSIPIWRYENSINEFGKVMSRVHISRCIFRNNSLKQKTGIIEIQNVYIILNNSTFESSQGTALYALRSVIHIEGFNMFDGNNGIFGGALNLNMSRIFVTSNSHTLITNNTAVYGGGVFALANLTILPSNKEDVTYNQCTVSKETVANKTYGIGFAGNKASKAGNSIFGGAYKNCRFVCKRNTQCSYTSSHLLEAIAHMASNESKDSEVVCPPSRLCICENDGGRECSKGSIRRTAFPGQTFTVSLVAMDELNEVRRAVVAGTICKDQLEENNACKKEYKHDIGYGQRMQELNQQCTNVTYTVNGQSEVSIEAKINYEETANILFDGMNLFNLRHLRNKDRDSVFIKVDLSGCPVGFQFEDTKKNGQPSGCKCLDYFHNRSISCNTNNGTVTKPYNTWLFSGTGVATEHVPTLVNRTVVHNRCPHDYCVYREKNINLSNPDEQCDFSRSGILCGACQGNLSMVLGTSNCKKCSNVYLLLIIPFALAGVALVVLLLKCNLTVSVGHINGIIFYANIVQVNKAILFPNQNMAYQIFSTFIAWLNLDLGVETCFFENMDSYAKVWLQFVFPVYLWIMVGLIITLANYSHRLGRLIGSNSVPVLATLFLLSYAKLLRTFIAATSFTYIVFDDSTYMTVWLTDGNLKYFAPQHTILFLVAILFGFLYILPLTLLVLLAPCLQARSHYKAFKWVNRLKPFLDAYQGPYSNKFRFWTGLLFILRMVLFVVYAFNYDNDPSMSFFWTNMVLFPFAMLCLITRNVYRHKLANHIETLSLLNIVILCCVNWLTTTTTYSTWQPIREYATYSSVVLMMITFAGIVFYQLVRKIRPNAFNQQFTQVKNTTVEADHQVSAEPPTSTTVELEECVDLKEPLLDSN